VVLSSSEVSASSTCSIRQGVMLSYFACSVVHAMFNTIPQPHHLLAAVNVMFALSFIAGFITALCFRFSVFFRAQCAHGSVLLILTRVIQ
jgi:hypothetical protein